MPVQTHRSLAWKFSRYGYTINPQHKTKHMEQHVNQPGQDNPLNRKDPEPGRSDRDLPGEQRQQAPAERDLPVTTNDAGDETYEDEEMNDPDYFEKRAGDDVRK